MMKVLFSIQRNRDKQAFCMSKNGNYCQVSNSIMNEYSDARSKHNFIIEMRGMFHEGKDANNDNCKYM